MHKEILNNNQIELLPLIKQFKHEFYLVGGTAIALHIGHRRSIDFDLFKFGSLNVNRIIKNISAGNYPYFVTRRVEEQLNLLINEVKFTFLEYPYSIDAKCKFEGFIRLPALLELAAMKAFALGRRSKWKDYIDLYYILRDHYSIEEIIQVAGNVYGDLFSEKLFRAQICYFNDIDYSESIEFLDKKASDNEIKEFLTNIALDI
ncbi:MAG: nucleotidyl transferase AbiEii/AbiGii toxin family protein [Bacteroidales bacterium]|nr:nucleotidyl transferase AbiEii/AbiGii toxin family protein [Bacteroidales bacterium]MCF8402529.1 nucleotidyl transferase AbiEii/AbiGii toxin family protein [Bacteroidales bacterium]